MHSINFKFLRYHVSSIILEYRCWLITRKLARKSHRLIDLSVTDLCALRYCTETFPIYCVKGASKIARSFNTWHSTHMVQNPVRDKTEQHRGRGHSLDSPQTLFWTSRTVSTCCESKRLLETRRRREAYVFTQCFFSFFIFIGWFKLPKWRVRWSI